MSHTDVIEKNRIEKLWFSFKNWFICFFPHELTCMGSYHLLLKFPPIKHTIFFTKRQCVTSSEIWITGQTKHRGLGGGPVCFFERDAIFLECSKANFDEFWKFFDIKFWCHTLTHGTVLRRLPLGLLWLSFKHGSDEDLQASCCITDGFKLPVCICSKDSEYWSP